MTTNGADGPPTPWPGGAAEVAGVPESVEPARLDEILRDLAAQAIASHVDDAAAEGDPWRQGFHVQPPVGLLNDPNGLVQHNGVYHLCYQWHPFGPRHGLKFWAHLTSTDLVSWQTQPIALAPSQAYEHYGCYSGSGIVHNDEVMFFYTGNVRTPDGGRTPFQLAASIDAAGNVVKDRHNPLLGLMPGCTSHVRDPKVWTANGWHWMVLGAQTSDHHGTVLLLRSDDLIDWQLLGPIGGGADDPHGYMWECPDLMHVGGREVLVVSPQFDYPERPAAERFVDEAQYAVGTLAVDQPWFHREGSFRALDAGPDFYAPQSFTDATGRTVMIGWMGKPDHDGQPSLAEKHPTVANGWVHCLTVPRAVNLEAGALTQWPVAELESLRGTPTVLEDVTLAGDASAPLTGVHGPRLDLEFTVTVEPGGTLDVALRDGDAGRPVVLRLDPHAGTAVLDRTRLGTGEGGTFTGQFRPGHTVSGRILLDHSSIEVFLDGGRLVFSARIYPGDDEQVTLSAHHTPATLTITGWPLVASSADIAVVR